MKETQALMKEARGMFDREEVPRGGKRERQEQFKLQPIIVAAPPHGVIIRRIQGLYKEKEWEQRREAWGRGRKQKRKDKLGKRQRSRDYRHKEIL